jgi:glutamate transport system substrate-binding protein
MAVGAKGRAMPSSGTTGRFTWPVRGRGVPGPAGTAEDIAVQDVAEREAADQRLPPPDPEPMLDPPPRFSVAAFRLAALGLALVLALALALVRIVGDGPPSVADLRARAGVDTWTVLPIGVKADQPGVAYYDKTTKIWSGFDIDIAYMIAEDLGFRRQEVKFYAIESEDRARMQATDPAHDDQRVPVKMVIASYSRTDARIALGANFSDPYLFTEQSVLTLAGHKKVSTLDDLAKQRVCTLSASTSLEELNPNQKTPPYTVVAKNKISECITALRAHDVDAVSTDAAILAGYKKQSPDDFAHWDLGLDATEKWAVNVGADDPLRKLVDVTLYRSWKDPHDDRWELAWLHNLQPEIGPNLPTPIAEADQPPVKRPDVRKLPWEDTLP